VTVGAEERFAWLSKILHVDRMADAVPWAAEPEPKSLAGALQKKVIVCVLMIGLDQILINILNGNLGLRPFQIHGFQFQHDQSAGCVLGQRLIDANSNHFSGHHIALEQMTLD
jgi:hypothetical protein